LEQTVNTDAPIDSLVQVQINLGPRVLCVCASNIP